MSINAKEIVRLAKITQIAASELKTELSTCKDSLQVAEDKIAAALEVATWKPSVMSSSEDIAAVYAGRLNDIKRILEGKDEQQG